MIVFKTNRSYYSPQEAEEETITVGELKELLDHYDDDEKIAFNNDNGYTYGYINADVIEEEYVPHKKKYLAEGIEYDFDEDYDDPKDLENLPKSMTVECYDRDEVADAISDETGWCVNSIETITVI